MLRKFTIENFKCFKKKFVLDLSTPGNYSFNKECIRNSTIDKAAIYGINGIGKSNFGLAVFDIVNTLTDKNKLIHKYSNFLNLNSEKPSSRFEYEFDFDGDIVLYKYSKRSVNELIEESLSINGLEMLYYDFREKKGFSSFEGSEKLNLNSDSSNSRTKFVMETSILNPENKENIVLGKFKKFVNNMLLFYSLKENNFIGFKQNGSMIENLIIEAGKVKDFENFVNSEGLDIHLTVVDTPEGKKLYFKYQNGMAYFFNECSTGMSSLILIYSWLLEISNCSFVYIDEFDAFYHYELAEMIVKKLKSYTNTQIIVTTHNTDLMNNDLMRPDCYFILNNEKIDSLNHLTEKDLRLAHNLQKMFKAGSFNE